MRRITMLMLMLMLSVGLVLGGAAACSDDDGPGDNNNNEQPDATVQPDVEVLQDAEVQPDAAPPYVQGCTGEPIDTPGGPGACCNDEDDCETGYCTFFKWCSNRCTSDGDCSDTVDGPFPTGTPMVCNVANETAWVTWCVPGSAQYCARENDPPCPDGESCVLAFSNEATGPSDSRIGICITSFTAPGTVETGGLCSDSDHPYPYQCSAPNFYYAGCNLGRCSEACDPANPNDTCPSGMVCPDYRSNWSSNGVPYTGAGNCTGTVCGRLEFTGDDDTDIRMPGRNGDCPSGEFCQYSSGWGIEGGTMLAICTPSDPSMGQVGDPCEHADNYDLNCDNGGLCIQKAPVYDPAGAFCTEDEDCTVDQVCEQHATLPTKRCTAKPDPGVCSAACRTGDDCPDLNGVPSLCIRRDEVEMVNGLMGFIAWCQDWRYISDDPQVFCDSSADCDVDVGELCSLVSENDSRKVCLRALEQDVAGADCSTNGVADCQANEACVQDEDAGTFLCTPYLTAGATCDPTGIQCIGSCLDMEGSKDDNGTPTNTYCVDRCASNADCGANAVCDFKVTAANDPTTHADDVVKSVCRTMMVRSGIGCAIPADCTNGDDCDTTTGRCFTTAADWGGACTQHSDCPQYGKCDAKVFGGMCYRPGCDPAAGNAGCDNTGACSDFFGVGLCLESCTTTTDCSRNAEGFTCDNGACVQPPYIRTDI